MAWLQIVSTILFFLWMFGTAWLGWKIWRESSRKNTLLERTLQQTVPTLTETARQSTETARMLSEIMKKQQERQP